MLGEPRAQVLLDALLEHAAVERLGPTPQQLGLEAVGVRLEAVDDVDQVLDRLPREEESRWWPRAPGRHHRLADPALPEREDGPSRRHRLERCDPEILERGEEQRAAARVQVGHGLIVAPAEELDARPREGAQAALLGARPHDEKPPPRAVGRLDSEVDALVWS